MTWFSDLDTAPSQVESESGPLSQWLYAGLAEAGFAVELIETRPVRNALKAMPIKPDEKDARGIAQLMRLGWLRPVPLAFLGKSLSARKLVQARLHDVEMSLRGFSAAERGATVAFRAWRWATPRTYEARVRELVEGHLIERRGA